MVTSFGVQALLYIVVHILFLVVTWWALQSFRIDVFFKDPEGVRAKVFLLFLAIAVSSAVGNFFLHYFYETLRLKYLF